MAKSLIEMIKENLKNKFNKVELQSSKSSHYFYLNGKNLKYRVSDHDAICGRSMTKSEVITRYMNDYGYNCTFEKLGFEPFNCFEFDLEELTEQEFTIPNDVTEEELIEENGEFWTKDIKWLAENIANYFEKEYNKYN